MHACFTQGAAAGGTPAAAAATGHNERKRPLESSQNEVQAKEEDALATVGMSGSKRQTRRTDMDSMKGQLGHAEVVAGGRRSAEGQQQQKQESGTGGNTGL